MNRKSVRRLRYLFSYFFLRLYGCSGLEMDEGAPVEVDEDEFSSGDSIPVSRVCDIADFITYPIPEADYLPGSYAGRRFLNPLDHCGEDCLVVEGMAIRAIGDGTIKVFRAAEGYGELVVVVEHDLGREISFRNGNGEIVFTRYLLSIYGHLRKSQTRGGAQLGWQPGDCVSAGDVVGYANDDLHNGDGDVHLHMGIRLMDAETAMDRDDSWFRGYDEDDGRWRGDFAAFSEVVSGVLNSVSHHPDGALIKTADNPDIYLVCNDGQKCLVSDEEVWRDERFWVADHPDGEWHKMAIVTQEEMDCYPNSMEISRGVRRRLIECEDGDFLWREDNENRQVVNFNRRSDEYEELARSWGFDPDEIERDEWMCRGEESFDPLYLRDGTLVREEDRPDVYFVTAHGVARPVEFWDLFIAMGYQENDIQWVPSGSLRNLVREVRRDQMIDWENSRTCGAEAGDQGGGGVCQPSTEVCDGADNDCDGAVDNGVLNACGTCGTVPNETCGNGVDEDCDGLADEGCNPVCNPTPEVCDGMDNDCDETVDEGVRNACGDCGAVPNEVCDSIDNDCDGVVDEGVRNACGQCGNVPAESCGNNLDDDCDGSVDEGCSPVCNPVTEICNGSDDDCDGFIDEGLLNACGRCGALPAEVCDGADNDCDGVVDDGVRNACGGCGQVPVESCNGIDDDCDGNVDEGVLNACGQCGSLPAEVCDGADNDCDGLIDEGVDCDPRGHTVRVRFCPREDGTFDSDLPDGNGWYARTMDDGCIDITWNNVSDGEYRLQGTYLDGTAWECNEWPAGNIWLRNNTVPEVWVDGVQVEVTYGHDPRMGVGCNFFATVS